MQEEIYSGKYGLMGKVRENEVQSIQALAALSDIGYIDVRTIERILNDEMVLTTKSIVNFVCAIDRLFNFVGRLISETTNINVACLCKMHSLIDLEGGVGAGVLRQVYTPNEYRYLDFPAVISSQELQTKLDITQRISDKKVAAIELFKLILRSYPFYSWNVIIAFMVADVVLIKYDEGFIHWEDTTVLDKLGRVCDKITEGKDIVKYEKMLDSVVTQCIVK